MCVAQIVSGCIVWLLFLSLQGCNNGPADAEAFSECLKIEDSPNRTSTSDYNIPSDLIANATGSGALPAELLTQAVQAIVGESSFVSGLLDQIPATLDFDLGGKLEGGTDIAGCK